MGNCRISAKFVTSDPSFYVNVFQKKLENPHQCLNCYFHTSQNAGTQQFGFCWKTGWCRNTLMVNAEDFGKGGGQGQIQIEVWKMLGVKHGP